MIIKHNSSDNFVNDHLDDSWPPNCKQTMPQANSIDRTFSVPCHTKSKFLISVCVHRIEMVTAVLHGTYTKARQALQVKISIVFSWDKYLVSCVQWPIYAIFSIQLYYIYIRDHTFGCQTIKAHSTLKYIWTKCWIGLLLQHFTQIGLTTLCWKLLTMVWLWQ